VIVFGGDGTINEAAQALSGMNVPLGILPGGTACVLANELGLGNNPVRAARALTGASPRRIAIGRLAFGGGESRSFLMMAGIGFDAHIVHGLDLTLKDRIGKLAYWAGAMREIGRTLEEFDIEADGVLRRGSFALVSRTRNYGGDVTIARGASLLSEGFEVVLLGGSSVLRYIWYFAAIMLRLERKVGGITIFRAHRLRVTPMRGEHVHVQVDGEYAGEAPATIEIVPDAISLLIPAAFRG
jgi:diacylglycerol kinase family enzyme